MAQDGPELEFKLAADSEISSSSLSGGFTGTDAESIIKSRAARHFDSCDRQVCKYGHSLLLSDITTLSPRGAIFVLTRCRKCFRSSVFTKCFQESNSGDEASERKMPKRFSDAPSSKGTSKEKQQKCIASPETQTSPLNVCQKAPAAIIGDISEIDSSTDFCWIASFVLNLEICSTSQGHMLPSNLSHLPPTRYTRKRN